MAVLFPVITVALSRVTQRPLDPFVSSSFLAISNMPLLSAGPLIGGGGHHVLNITPPSSFGPGSFTPATQPDFVYASPISVYVSAGGVSIESRETHVQRICSPGWPQRQRGIFSILTRSLPPLRQLFAVRQRSAPLFGLSGRVHAPLRLPRPRRKYHGAHSLRRYPPSLVCARTRTTRHEAAGSCLATTTGDSTDQGMGFLMGR